MENLLRQCAEEFLNESPELNGLTVDDILAHSMCRGLIESRAADKQAKAKAEAEKKDKKAAEERRAKLNAELAAAAAKLQAERRISAKELSNVVGFTFEQKLEAAGQPIQPVQEIPGPVLEAKEAHGGKLPSCVFVSANEALLFRAIVIGGIKSYSAILAKQDLDQEYRDLVELLFDRAKYLAEMTSSVLRQGWGIDPKGKRVENYELFRQIRGLVVGDHRFAFLVNIMTPVMIKAKKADMEAAEAKAASRARVREETIKLLLASGMVPEAANKRALRVIKDYLDDAKGDIKLALRLVAVNKMRSAQTDEEKLVAAQYAQAAGLSDADFVRFIAEAEKADAKERSRRQFLDFGGMSAATEAARKAKKKGGGDGGKKNKRR
jgi:hypothetical protein